MSPLPKRRWSTRRQGKKAATFKAAVLTGTKCANCGETIVSHHLCPKCGFYKGKQIHKVKIKKVKEKSSENKI